MAHATTSNPPQGPTPEPCCATPPLPLLPTASPQFPPGKTSPRVSTQRKEVPLGVLLQAKAGGRPAQLRAFVLDSTLVGKIEQEISLSGHEETVIIFIIKFTTALQFLRAYWDKVQSLHQLLLHYNIKNEMTVSPSISELTMLPSGMSLGVHLGNKQGGTIPAVLRAMGRRSHSRKCGRLEFSACIDT